MTGIKGILYVFVISMVPIIELRGAIPVGVAADLPVVPVFIVSIIGNLLPAPFIIIFARKILHWLRSTNRFLGDIAEKLEERAYKKSDVLKKYSLLGLFILVAIPLPGTGAWTGSLVAALLKIHPKDALPPIAAGVLTAGIIVAASTMGAVHIFGL